MVKLNTRNKSILYSVLNGLSYKQVGVFYGISTERIRQISMNLFKEIAPEIYLQTGFDIKKMRAHKQDIVND